MKSFAFQCGLLSSLNFSHRSSRKDRSQSLVDYVPVSMAQFSPKKTASGKYVYAIEARRDCKKSCAGCQTDENCTACKVCCGKRSIFKLCVMRQCLLVEGATENRTHRLRDLDAFNLAEASKRQAKLSKKALMDQVFILD